MRTALAALLLLVPQDDVEKKLDARISISVRGSLAQMAEALQAHGFAVVVDRRAENLVDVRRAAELSLKDVPARSAVRWAARLYGLSFAVEDGAVVIGHPDHLLGRPQSRMFDIGGLTSRPADFPAPVFAPARDPAAPEPVVVLEQGEIRDTPEEATIDLIKSAVAPGSWDGEKAAIVPVQPGRITVRHYPAVLDRVEALVGALRRLAPAMVTVEAEAFELDAEGQKVVDTLPGAALDEARAKALMAALAPLRRAKGAETLRFTCSEGQLSHVLLSPPAAVAKALPYNTSTVLEVRPVVAGGSVKMDLAFRMNRVVAHEECPTTITLRSTTVVPNRGAAVFLLPRCFGAKGSHALVVRASAAGDGATEAEVAGGDAADAAVAAKLEGAAAMDLDLADAPAADAARAIADKAGINLVLHPELLERRLTLRAKGLRPRLALRVLFPEHAAVARDGAVYVGPPAGLGDRALAVSAIRDLALAARGPDDEIRTGGAAYRPRDVADLVRAGVPGPPWDDADFNLCTATDNGLLVVRNAPSAVAETRRFLEELRRRPAAATVRAEIVILKPDAADEALANGESGYLLPADAAAKLVAASQAPPERLHLEAILGHRAGVLWEHRRPSALSPAKSSLDVLASAAPGGLRLTLSLEAHDDHEADDKAAVSGRAILRTTVKLPAGKAGVFKLGAAQTGDKQSALRLLIVRAQGRE